MDAPAPKTDAHSMSRVYDTSSEIYSLYSHPMTRASSITQDSEPLTTPPDETFLGHRYKAGAADGKAAASHDAVHIRSATPETLRYLAPERRLDALHETPEHEESPYGPYFSLPRDPTSSGPSPAGLARKRTTKELIGRFESMSERSEARTAVSSVSTKVEQRRARPGAYPAIEQKKGRSPIRQSIRNILSVFKKNKSAWKEQGGESGIAEEAGRPQVERQPAYGTPTHTVPQLSALKESKDLSQCTTPLEPGHARRSGPLLHLSHDISPSVHPVWANCTATLHSTHLLLTWHTRRGNPSTDIISFNACTDVRSMSLSELDANERAMLPVDAREAKVFELLFEGRPREKFAAKNVGERATWVSAIWDAILLAQEQRTEAASIRTSEILQSSTVTERNSTAQGRPALDASRNSSQLTVQTVDSSASSRVSNLRVDRALPEIPKTLGPQSSAPRLSLQIPGSAIRSTPSPTSALSPLPRPPTTPTRQTPTTPTRSQSPSILNLDKKSMVRQRLAQLESTNSPTSPTRASMREAGSPSPLRANSDRAPRMGSEMRRDGSSSSAGASSILDSYGAPSMASPLSAYSGRLTSNPPTSSTPTRDVAPWSGSGSENSSALLKPPVQDVVVISPASKYSTDDQPETSALSASDDTMREDMYIPNQEDPQVTTRRPIIRLDTDASSLGPPMIWQPPPAVEHGPPPNRVNCHVDKPVLRVDTGTGAWKPTPHHEQRGALGTGDLRQVLEAIGGSVKKLEGRADMDTGAMTDIRSKVNAILTEIRSQPGPSDGPASVDISAVLQKLEDLRSELRIPEQSTVSRSPIGPVHSDVFDAIPVLHEKLDILVALYEGKQSVETTADNDQGAGSQGQHIEEVLTLLRSGQTQWAAQAEQQTDSIRYLNELNTWLEAFVNHGVSQIESVTAGVQQLCKDLGPVPEMQEQNEEGDSQRGSSLLTHIRKLLVEIKGREDNSVVLHASVNGLIAAVQEDLKQNAEARNTLTTESLVGLIDRQRQDHERMLRALGTELSNEIRGERLRFVEAMKEATAINVQIHVEEFKKELTREVLLMTQEVGRLQRERQGLEQQIADLFAFYAKQKQSGGLFPTTKQNMRQGHPLPRPQPSSQVPGGYPVAARPATGGRRPLPSPVVTSRPASSFV